MAPVLADAPFVGRSEHLARLGEVLDAVAGRRPSAVLVGGDAGVGKTRLVSELGARAAGRGFLVLAGRSVDLGAGGLPYLPFVDALRSMLRAGGPGADVVRRATMEWPVLLHLAGRAAAGGPLDDADRLPLFDAVASVIAQLTDEVAPVLLVLEDVHWADASTRDLLRFVLSRLRDERLLVTVTFRTDDLHRRHPLRPLLAELVRLPGVERLDLAPFDHAELARLLATVSGAALPDGEVTDIARRSGGNAFFALELLAAQPPQVRPGGLGQLPDALSDVLLTRLEGLDPAAQHIVRAASVAGRCVPDRLLRAAVAITAPQADLDAALREAADRHVLVADGPDRYSFRHALLQEAVYADLLPGERVRLHAAYATLLAGEFADADDSRDADLAEHALRSHDTAGALAASWRAARAAQAQLAPLDALEHAERALGLWEAVPADRRPDDGDHIDLLLLAASAAAHSGDATRAQGLATAARDEALQEGDPLRVAQARRHLARHLYAAERVDACMEEATLARETLLGYPPSADLVWATAVMANAAHDLGDLESMATLATSGLELARSLGLAAAEADLLITLSFVAGHPPHGQAGYDLEMLRQARDRARSAREPGIELRALWNMGQSRHDADDLVAAAALYREVEARAVQTGLAASLYAVEARIALVEVLFRLGAWDEATVVARAEGLRLGHADTTALHVTALRVTAARDPAAARAAASELRATQPDRMTLNPFSDVSLHVVQAEAALWCAEPDDAVAQIVAALARVDARDPMHLVSVRVCAVGLAALATGGRPAPDGTADATADARADALADVWLLRAEAAMTAGGPGVGREGRAWLLRARAEHARVVHGALTGATTGRPDLPDGRAAAVSRWEEILALVEGQPYEQAQVRLRLAEAFADAGDRLGAGAVARSAHAAAGALRARPLREAVEALGRRARIDLGAGIPSASGPLTPREAEVLGLVAEGLTNRVIGQRLFISEKTASVHVSNILGKLGASGRAEAVAIAGRRGLLGADPARDGA